jgi:hypothetical protein
VEPPQEGGDDGPLGADGRARAFAVRVRVNDGGAHQVGLEQQVLSFFDLGLDLGDKARFPVEGRQGLVEMGGDKVDPLLDLAPREGVVVVDDLFEQRRDPGVSVFRVHPDAGDGRPRGIDGRAPRLCSTHGVHSHSSSSRKFQANPSFLLLISPLLF